MTSLPLPVPIPLSPLPPLGAPVEPQTPTMSRHRSSTILTTSSASSTHLQTPQTPSIMGLLSGNISPSGTGVALSFTGKPPLPESPAEAGLTRRASSYDFGDMLQQSATPPSSSPSPPSPPRGTAREELARAIRSVSQGSALSGMSEMGEGASAPALSLGSRLGITPATRSPPNGPAAEASTTAPAPSPPLCASDPPSSRPELLQSKAWIKTTTSTVRRTLGRSKTSFRVLGRPNQDDGGGGGAPSSSNADADATPPATSASSSHPSSLVSRRSRLKTLITLSKTRSRSSSSLRSGRSGSSNVTSVSEYQAGVSASASVQPPSLGYRSRSLLEETSERASLEGRRMSISGDGYIWTRSGRAEVDDEPERKRTGRWKGKGKARAYFSAAQCEMVETVPPTHFYALPPSHGGLATSDEEEMYLDSLSAEPVPMDSLPLAPEVSWFEELLPHEIKVMVMQYLLDSFRQNAGEQRRISGDVEGRKELVKLSRVSKSWEAMCFDGQLWPLVHLTPLAHVLSAPTVCRILRHSSPFITELSLRGMDRIGGEELLRALAMSVEDASERKSGAYRLPGLPSLIKLNLQGCRSLSSDELIAMISHSPSLRHVILKGVPGVTRKVLDALCDHCPLIEEIDVSRCRGICIGDVSLYLRDLPPQQVARIRVLRVAGLAVGGSKCDSEFFGLVGRRLTGLQVLDLQGLEELCPITFKAFTEGLDMHSFPSQLTHLNISGCTIPTDIYNIFRELTGRLPHLTHLEMAGVKGYPSWGWSATLAGMLRSMPKLIKVDMEALGIRGDAVVDEVLGVLTPEKDEVGVTGCELVELRLGYARDVSSEQLIRLIRGCPKLKVLELDNTNANNAVLREFNHRRTPDSSISVIDCRLITQTAYSGLYPPTRPRSGWEGWAAAPFGYDKNVEVGGDLTVVKAFYSWRRVRVPNEWREARDEAMRHVEEDEGGGTVVVNRRKRPRFGRERQGSWWRIDEDFDDRVGCVIM